MRAVTQGVNQDNRAGANRGNSTGVRGVVRHGDKFIARIGVNYKLLHIGRFDTIEEAEYAVNMKRKELQECEKRKN